MGPGEADLPGAVLFACSRNAVRSPMAAAILKHLAGNRIYVDSAGVRAGEPDLFAIAAMEELGIDLSGHRPTALADLHATSFDLIVTLSPEAHHKALELTRTLAADVEYWRTTDPTAVEGSRLLMERLKGKVLIDIATARRLFTLICALHWKG